MNDNSEMPFGLSNDPDEFAHRIEEVKSGLRKHFGANVPATSAVSEALLKSLIEMREGKTPTGFWVRVTRRAIDLLRRRQRHQRLLEKLARDPGADSIDPVEEAAARELLENLVRAAEGLTPTEREVWLLHCEGASEIEISQLLNKSHPAIKMALSRARQHVRAHMAGLAARKE
jgi:RNA polymerase sigma factor (sigma-70 family)